MRNLCEKKKTILLTVFLRQMQTVANRRGAGFP